MTAAATSGEPALQSFITGLRADQDAVTAGLTLRWSSGSVEGHINRIKMLKRPDVRTRKPRPAPPPRTPCQLTSRKLCQSQFSPAVDTPKSFKLCGHADQSTVRAVR